MDFGALWDERNCERILAKDAVREEDYWEKMATGSVKKERRDEGKATFRMKGPAVRAGWAGEVTVRAEVMPLQWEMAGQLGEPG